MSFSEATKAKNESFKNGEDYGKGRGRAEGYDEAFVVFLRMLEVEKERTANIDRRIALSHIIDNTKVLKDVICL